MKAAETIPSNRDNHELRIDASVTSATTLFNNVFFIILTLEQHESIGVLVDEVKEVVTLDEEHIERMGYEKDDKERFLSGVGKSDGKLISLLDITSVLAEVVDA